MNDPVKAGTDGCERYIACKLCAVILLYLLGKYVI
jgi:hypothetical protein